jgi:SAM-dependent methyltransferase
MEHRFSHYSRSAAIYDELNAACRDYPLQARRVVELVRSKMPSARTLLDVACGTGLHMQHWARYFECDGLDVSGDMLAIARGRNPGSLLICADMRNFVTGRRYDAITCMFSSITYALDYEGLVSVLRCCQEHLNPGGVCVIESFVCFEDWVDMPTGTLRGVDLPHLTVALVDRAERNGRRVTRELVYTVATSEGIEVIPERYEFGLFTREEYLQAFESEGFQVDILGGFELSRPVYVAQLRRRPRASVVCAS